MTRIDCLVREATVEDLESLFPLARDFATSFIPVRDSFDQAARSILIDDAAWLGVAEHAGTLVGYCLGFEHLTFYANGRVSWIEEVMVAEAHRRHGIGRCLISAFEKRARTRGSKLIALATRRAQPFYEAIG
jgi:GNAT superfamily N-acetyltransferase